MDGGNLSLSSPFVSLQKSETDTNEHPKLRDGLSIFITNSLLVLFRTPSTLRTFCPCSSSNVRRLRNGLRVGRKQVKSSGENFAGENNGSAYKVPFWNRFHSTGALEWPGQPNLAT